MSGRPFSAHVTGWDRAAIVVLGAAGCSLSYSALQQMAVAIHVRPGLCWLFPLAIDGFITYGVRALLVLRTAPLRARLYVWTLFGTATAVSVWANALHAVRLNRAVPSATVLRLADPAVAALSTVAPLALAGAVHLYIIIARRPDSSCPTEDIEDGVRPGGPGAAGAHRKTDLSRTDGHMSSVCRSAASVKGGPAPSVRTATGQSVPATGDGGTGRTRTPSGRQIAALSGGTTARTQTGRPSGSDGDRLLDIARKAVVAEGRLTRKVVAQAVRGQGVSLSNDALTGVMARLRQESGHPDIVSRT